MQKEYRSRFILIALLLSVFVVLPFLLPKIVCATFDPNYLLSDSELTNGDAFSKKSVQSFLDSQGGALAKLLFSSVGSVMKPAAEIIYDAGRYYDISPKYLLVRLQIEQSLVTTMSPTQRQIDFATGYGCPDSSGCDNSKKGFFNQVNWAAKRVRESYLTDLNTRGFTISGWGPGITKQTLDGYMVTPKNKATAAMYTYTPHVYYGNYNLWKYWNEWFALRFPDGAIVKNTEANAYYLISGGKKRPFRSMTVLQSNYDIKKVLPASPGDLGAYENGNPIIFENYSLIRSPRGTVFLIVDGVKRGIASYEVFRTLGFNPEEVQAASWDDIHLYPDGPTIDLSSAYPTGSLLQSIATGGIAYVERGIRHPIFSKEILHSRFHGVKVLRVSDKELTQYPVGDPVTFCDGEIITTEGEAVYFIFGGNKRPFASKETFESLGFKWGNLIRTNKKSFALHPTGAPIDLGSSMQE